MDVYMLALQYGIPPETVDAVLPPILGFLAVLVFGKPLASLIIRKTSGGSPGAAAMVWPVTIAALILVPLASALSPVAGTILWVLMLVVVPFILGRAKRGEGVQEVKPRAVSAAGDLRQKLLSQKKEERRPASPAKETTKKKETRKQKKRRLGLRLSLPFGRKKEKAKRPVSKKGPEKGKKGSEKESVLVVEEIKLPATAKPAKAPAPTSAPAPTATKPKEAVPALPSPMEQQRKAFLKAVEELEQLASKTQIAREAQPATPAQGQATPAPEAEKYVEEVARVVEERIVRAGRHRFVTWREVREARRRAKEAVKLVKPVVKKKVEETLAKKGRITKEDLDAIAEEIFYQVQKGDVFAREAATPSPVTEAKKPREKPRKSKKRKGEEEQEGGEEDLLALLGGEGGEEELSEGGEDMDELLKLLGE